MSKISLTQSKDVGPTRPAGLAGTPDPARPAGVDGAQIAAVREFSRFYTNVLGLLREGLLDSPYSLTEGRVMFELALQPETEVARLRARLDIDAGYLSRILARFEADGLIRRSRSAADGRRQVIALTGAGREVFARLDDLSAQQARVLLGRLAPGERRRLTGAMAEIRQILGSRPPAARPAAFVIRPPGPGDLGWVVQRHGALYATEYGWDERFEALVARVVADYAQGRDRRQAAWIAEVDGDPAGCVFCTRKDDTTAQLRLLLVEPSARGMGIGERLVSECVSFARKAGYREIVLWTNSVLDAARRIYQRAGFELTSSQPYHGFGHDLVGEDWALSLA